MFSEKKEPPDQCSSFVHERNPCELLDTMFRRLNEIVMHNHSSMFNQMSKWFDNAFLERLLQVVVELNMQQLYPSSLDAGSNSTLADPEIPGEEYMYALVRRASSYCTLVL